MKSAHKTELWVMHAATPHRKVYNSRTLAIFPSRHQAARQRFFYPRLILIKIRTKQRPVPVSDCVVMATLTPD